MSSSYETLGVVLGAFPLILSALDHYKEAINGTAKSSSSFSQISSLETQVNVESVIFKNSCEELLSLVLEPADLERAFADLGGKVWQDPELESRMNEMLGSVSVHPVLMQECHAMISTLDEVMKELAKVGKHVEGLSQCSLYADTRRK